MTEQQHDHPTRLEGLAKVTGRAVYTSDAMLPGQLFAGIVRSRVAHAGIRRIDIGALRGIEGLRDVITQSDVGGITWYEEKVPLFSDRARFIGDEIAAVAADTEEAALDAVRACNVEYDLLDCVVGVEAATADGAARVHESAPGNRAGEPDTYERGDIAAGFAEADVIIEGTYVTQAALHNALEPHVCNAWWDGDCLNLRVSTQGIFAVRDSVAATLDLPHNRVRVRAEHVGGGFGAKQDAGKETVFAAILARKTGSPVCLMLDRRAENLATGHRNATRQHVRIGARRDGTLCAIEARVQIDIGAYTMAGESSDVTGCYQKLYACPNVSTTQTRLYSNVGPSVAFRGPGYVEGTFALEQAMDALALELGIDAWTLRQRNYTRVDQADGKPYSAPEGLGQCIDRLRTHAEARSRCVVPVSANKRRGAGIAASVWLAGGGSPPASAAVDVLQDGSIAVITGTQDIGTGTRTALAGIAAEALGQPIERISVALGDTATQLRSPPSAGSATLASLGLAVEAAAADARQRLLSMAASRLDTRAENLILEPGCVRSRAGASVKLSDLASDGPVRGHGTFEKKPDDVATRTFAAQYAEVEVDLDTASIEVLNLACAPDCGRVVNARLAESQVLGGVTQGLGFALTEMRITDSSGRVLNANLEDYLVPTAADVPPIEFLAVDEPDFRANRLGIKGLGEPPLIGVAPAIANAVQDAIGVRLYELPMNRKRVLQALRASRDAQ